MKNIQLFLAAIALSALVYACGSKASAANASFTTEIFCDHCEQCESCKGRVESALLALDGVSAAAMVVEDKSINVTYDAAKLDEQKIKVAISKTGFSAGDVPADPAAYDNLDDCCKRK